MPTITWIGSPNFWEGRSKHSVIAICDHITQGSEASVDGEFLNGNTDAPVSAHFCVNRDGSIHQYVSEANTAWANGILQSPNLAIKWVADAKANKVNPNLLTISIEHEGQTGIALTETQYQSTLWLHLRLIREFHLGYDKNSLVGHCDIDSINRSYCPGKAFPWERLRADISTALGATKVTDGGGGLNVDLTDPKGYLNKLSGTYACLKANRCYAVTDERSMHFDDSKTRVAVVDGVRYVDGAGVRVWYDAVTGKCELLVKSGV